MNWRDPIDSDKHYWHRYSRFYERHFSTVEPVSSILEYGILHGASIRWLREMFPKGAANYLNFVLFSTSGVHGSYCTIEKAEATVQRGNKDEDGEDYHPQVTFLVVHPRIVALRYGNCSPQTDEDFAFLKRLRLSSWKVVQTIGRADDEPEGT